MPIEGWGVPIIGDELIVNPYTYTVIGKDGEGVVIRGACLYLAGPASAEISRNACCGAIFSPVEIDLRIDTGDDGCATDCKVIEILAR